MVKERFLGIVWIGLFDVLHCLTNENNIHNGRYIESGTSIMIFFYFNFRFCFLYCLRKHHIKRKKKKDIQQQKLDCIECASKKMIVFIWKWSKKKKKIEMKNNFYLNRERKISNGTVTQRNFFGKYTSHLNTKPFWNCFHCLYRWRDAKVKTTTNKLRKRNKNLYSRYCVRSFKSKEYCLQQPSVKMYNNFDKNYGI